MRYFLNRTGINNPIGYVVKQDNSDPRVAVLADPSTTSVLGVVTGVIPGNLIISNTGVAEVFIYNKFTVGDTVYVRKSNEIGQSGVCYARSSPDTPYMKIGTVLETGEKRLATVQLDINYATLGSSGGETDPLSVHLDQTSPQTMIGTFNFPIVGTSQIKTNRTTATDLTIVTGAEKTVILDTAVWDDLRIVPSAFDFLGENDPSLTDWQPGGSGTTFKVWAFQTNDEAVFTVQLPHGYKEGTSLYVHVHWTPHTRGNEENGNTVAWKLNYSWANVNANFAAAGTVDMTDTCDGTDHKHQMTPEVEISGVGKTISSMLIGRVYRDTGDTWVGTTAAQSPAILEIDFHYSIDTVASRQRSAK